MKSLIKLLKSDLTKIDLLISNEARQLLKIYSTMNVECGGMLFGKNQTIVSLTMKTGNLTYINFSAKDFKLTIGPPSTKIIGTWHLHPWYNSCRPSSTDIKTWRKWKKGIHLIVDKEWICIYSYNGGKIYYEKIL